MTLKLMYITNNPEVAEIAQNYGVDRIWIDMEYKGKDERQRAWIPSRIITRFKISEMFAL